MDTLSLEESLDLVSDEKTFLRFLASLAADRADEVKKEGVIPSSPYAAGAKGWQNWSIEQFLESAAAWGEDSLDGMPSQPEIEGVAKWEKPANPWKRCAEIIYMGKHYE